jgi:single-stranded-DNA-specific exonuclease
MKRWNEIKHDRNQVSRLADALKVQPLIAALLISRGYDSEESAHKFLHPRFEDLHDAKLLKGIDKATARILKAIERDEKILIWGDYDVDGTTGTVILRKALGLLGAKTGYHVPDRFTEGYGLNIEKLEEAKATGYSVVVTVDNGSTAFDQAIWAKENGIDLIITDHHEIARSEKRKLAAHAFVNPHQAGCKYPDKNLAGVGVAYKLAENLLRERGHENALPAYLKIVAIGTIADMMNLTGENRAIVSLGLRDLPQTKNPGLRALMEVADCNSEMTSYDIGFRIAPRINAAGRMDAARAVVELFEAETFEKAREFAQHLDSRNRERQVIQKKIFELAFEEYVASGGAETQSHAIVVAGEGWHEGVIGLASSKITERLNRPSLVISVKDGIGKGSARSIRSFHLLDALDSCAELFEKHGGHAAACGFTIKEENVDQLRQRLNAFAKAKLSDEDLIPELRIDAPVSPATLNLGMVEELRSLQPFGIGNPKPVFVTKDLFLSDEPLIMKEKHLKFRLADKEGKRFEAVWWDGVEKSKGQTLNANSRIEIAYTPEANTWNGNTRLQLVVEDVRS